MSLSVNVIRGLVLYYARRYEEALIQLNRTLEMDATAETAYRYLVWTYLATGRYDDMAAALRRSMLLRAVGDTADASRLALGLADSTRRAQAFTVLARWERGAPSTGSSGEPSPVPHGLVGVARFYARLGNREKALALLEHAYRRRTPALYAVGVEPSFDSLRSEPRFQALLRKMGLP